MEGTFLDSPMKDFSIKLKILNHISNTGINICMETNRKIEALQLLIDNLNKDLQNSWDENDYEELREKNKN